MVFSLKVSEIDRRLRESNKGNGIPIIRKTKTEEIVSFICAGEYVHYGIDGECLGQVLDIVDYRDILDDEIDLCDLPEVAGSTRFVMIRRIEGREGLYRPEPDPHKYDNVSPHLNEAIPTANVAFISVEEVCNIAFLFHIDDLQEGKYDPWGMDNAYAVRRYRTPSGKMTPLQSDSFKSFHNPACYSKRQWDMMVATVLSGKAAIGYKGNFAGRTKSFKFVGANVESYYFFKDRIEEDSGDSLIKLKHNDSRPYKRMNHDLSVENVRMKQKSIGLRAVEEEGLQQFKKVFGKNFGVANGEPVPNWKAIDEGTARPKVLLKDDTVVRIVTCRQEDIDDEPGKERVPMNVASSNLNLDVAADKKIMERIQRQKKQRLCPYPGLEMYHTVKENGMTELKFVMKFKKMRADTEAVREIIRRPTEPEVPIPDEQQTIVAVVTEEETTPIDYDDPLRYDGNMYKIASVDEERKEATIVRLNPSIQEAPIVMDLAEATRLVNEYY